MAFLEWRLFQFFDIHKNVDNGKIAQCLQDTTVTVATSGNNHVVLCDVTGWAHLISRAWEITSFKAYELTVTLAQQLPHDPLLVTIGEEEPGVNPMIKVWDWSRTDRHGNPICVRVSRAVPSHMRPTPATALAVHEHKNLLAVGFQDGSVSLFRGDIARQRSGKMKTLPDTGTSPITGLAFKGADKLFVVSRACVMVFWLSSERCVSLDAMGAAPGCVVLCDKHRLTIANTQAIYCYTTEGRGPCYALEGDKVSLNSFRSYLVITTNETPPKASTSSQPAPKSHHITILDIQNKFKVFSKSFDEIDAVLTEWGSFYILTKKKEMIYLDEKDLQSKLQMLFKKNLYDVAIRIASSQHYDVEGLSEIYKQYGDHLYGKGDLKGAIEQYVKTIGWLETSYVIRKYLESRHLEPLVTYLEELHKKGLATEDHTTLLLTCYVKVEQRDQHARLRELLSARDAPIPLDLNVAIKVVRQVSAEDALSLASSYKRHDWYLTILLEDKKDYRQALEYISDLEFEDAERFMRQYGHRLIQHEPQLATDFLKLLCTDYRPRSQPLVDECALSGVRRDPERALPDDFIHMFGSNSARLAELLEHTAACPDTRVSGRVRDALLDHYIHVWAKAAESDKAIYEQKIMKVLKDPDANYDKDHTLVLCQMLGFKTGVLYLYEENKLWRAQVSLLARADDAEGALGVCRRRGAQCPALWLDLLWTAPPPEHLPEILNVIANEKLLSPTLVIDCLTSTPSYSLGDVRKYLMDILKSENEVITREQELASKYASESEKMKKHIASLQSEPVVFQSSRCAACNRTLELPTQHFLCQHSFHQHCFQSYSECEWECPLCAPPRRAPPPPHPAEQLHARLHHEHDGYAVVSEYFGRGWFNKPIVLPEQARDTPDTLPAPLAPAPAAPVHPPAAPAPPATPAPAAQTYGPGAEAKLRLQEGQSKQVFVPSAAKQLLPKGTAVVPVPEGRMRLLEQQRYSSSLEANMNRLEPRVHRHSPLEHPAPAPAPARDVAGSPKVAGNTVAGSPKISAAISNNSKNPFEDDDKNPFAEDEADDPSNPFNEDDDYDKNLNPFA